MPADSTTPVYHLSWDEFHRDTRALTEQLLAAKKSWRGIVAIARGGLIPAAIIAREMNIRLVDTLCVASYDHTQQVSPKILKQVDPEILKSVDSAGEHWLIVDDLVDTGTTAAIAKKILPQATMVAVYAKPAGKPTAAYWQREFNQNTWIHFPWDCAQQDGTHSYVAPLHQLAPAQ